MQMMAGREMTAFGYEPVAVRMPMRARLGFAIRDVPVESAHLLVWRTRERMRDRAGRPLRPDRLVHQESAA